MALVKPLEYTLRHGKVKVDVPARDQFQQTLPIVRRVKFGPIHVLCTYDPLVVHGDAPRDITLPDFDGLSGRTVTLPADSETRIFVLREEIQQATEQPVISRILFGSCLRENKPMPILETIAARRPDLSVFLGDNIYADIFASRKRWRRVRSSIMTQSGRGCLLSNGSSAE